MPSLDHCNVVSQQVNLLDTAGQLLLATPFAAAQSLPTQVWNAISILLGAAR